MGLDEDVKEQVHDLNLVLVLQTHLHHLYHPVYLGGFPVQKVDHYHLDQLHKDVVDVDNQHHHEVNYQQDIFELTLQQFPKVREDEVRGVLQASCDDRVYHTAHHQHGVHRAVRTQLPGHEVPLRRDHPDTSYAEQHFDEGVYDID